MYILSTHRRAVDTGRDRVECIIIGPDDPMNQELTPDKFLSQITVVLRANNFSVSETEISSGSVILALICISPTTHN